MQTAQLLRLALSSGIAQPCNAANSQATHSAAGQADNLKCGWVGREGAITQTSPNADFVHQVIKCTFFSNTAL
ncbi:MAG: hypothetical protein CVT76_00225 [Alphaproteobacteria bacterium HGW-Alphaproteobacteria-15]|nr:MAG: hypothetical protein CVT76_00225 [Alphaproteobacteria bacterium HGW-Alphaproteobacteria-15]